jgi:hypothetical protein
MPLCFVSRKELELLVLVADWMVRLLPAAIVVAASLTTLEPVMVMSFPDTTVTVLPLRDKLIALPAEAFSLIFPSHQRQFF